MTDIVDPTARAIADLRGDITALRAQIPRLMSRLEALNAGNAEIAGQYAAIIDMLAELKAGQPEAPKKAEFVSKRG
jgi:uncharacterized phage infection (PIP) family protein YhgE